MHITKVGIFYAFAILLKASCHGFVVPSQEAARCGADLFSINERPDELASEQGTSCRMDDDDQIACLTIQMKQNEKYFQARMTEKQAECDEIRKQLHQQRGEFEEAINKRLDQIEVLKVYMNKMEEQRASVPRLVGLTMRLIGSKIGFR